jgi:glycosyltransferase involved in cell wall biosynthesis
LADTPYEAVLVIGGTRNLAGLWWVKRRGVPIIQRLDGMNWIHRKTRTGVRHYLRAEYGNFILSLIRARLADRLIYQSEFSRQWWERVYGKKDIPWKVVHNGVDIDIFTPAGTVEMPKDQVRILLVEGTIGGGYEFGLQTAAEIASSLQSIYHRKIELMVVGRISKSLRESSKRQDGIQMTYMGQVAIDRIPALDRSAHVLYAADLFPACPNSVIEALACGLPVAGFDTGSLAEIVTQASGEVVPYGADPWNLEHPDINRLAEAIEHLLHNQAAYKKAARHRAEQAFGLERMIDGYLEGLML